MAKTAKVKYDPKANPRSRASKRATSPSINTDKSLKSAPRVSGSAPVLGAVSNGGIQKSKSKSKRLSRNQRLRQEQKLERAEAVMDQMERKVDSSKTRLKKRNARKGTWTEVNEIGKIDENKALLEATAVVAKGYDDEWEDVEFEGDEDADMMGANPETGLEPKTATEQVMIDPTVPVSAPVAADEDEGEIT